MSSSWHNFLFASLDPSGVMTVDKPPLALWVQALSVRAFGYQPLSVLVPQALIGVASVALTYDRVRRRFGRLGGFVGGLALALTPMTVAISRHNNPDALLVLCCVAALWSAVRALELGRARWLALAGVCVGLGFETKMGVALTVVPGIALAWLAAAPRGRRLVARGLGVFTAAAVAVGGAWPALVELTPAGARPWVAGTSDNRALSLIFGYNGLGRVDGQAGGPGGARGPGGGALFGSAPGPLRGPAGLPGAAAHRMRLARVARAVVAARPHLAPSGRGPSARTRRGARPRSAAGRALGVGGRHVGLRSQRHLPLRRTDLGSERSRRPRCHGRSQGPRFERRPPARGHADRAGTYPRHCEAAGAGRRGAGATPGRGRRRGRRGGRTWAWLPARGNERRRRVAGRALRR